MNVNLDLGVVQVRERFADQEVVEEPEVPPEQQEWNPAPIQL